MDVAIIGTGAIGGYYGAKLARAGHRVCFLARSDYQRLVDHGIAVESVAGDFDLPPQAFTVRRDPADLPACDLVCLTAKATANDDLLALLGPALKPGATILAMQNGFGVEERLAGLYPQAHVCAGLCFVCVTRPSPGHIRHTAYGTVSLAPLDPGDAPLVEDLARVLTAAGLEAPVLGDVLTARLRKLVWNIPFNGLSVVLEATTGDLLASPPARRLLTALMGEVLAAARACGVVIEEAFIPQMLAVTESMASYDPSMRLDHLAGRPMEIDAIYRQVMALARAHGFDMALAGQLADQLEHIQNRPPAR
ncbi:MAG: 2-dehydropantoate 2-reductase [Propionibacteriaceae bacterium]|jgi:2-dehydropantoate 2-reductase|nr:2-dehydropantoate 2-reductase [Propionibacteriaceae bacterium]